MTRRLTPILSLAICWVLAACGDDECKVGNTRCVSNALIATCLENSDEEPEWLVHQCPADERCEADALPDATAGGSSDAGAPEAMAACVGTCEQGESECVTPELARYCVNGRAWQLDPCSVGESCVAGSCQLGGDAAVRVCDPGERSCASDDVEKICDVDGTQWVTRTCNSSEACLVDRCAPDPDASCDEGSRCLDNETALRCLGEGRGFERVACEGDTYCQAGRCRGPVCAVGSVCAAPNQVRQCVDGTSFRDVQCAANEVCKQDGDEASCVSRNCVPGAAVCGDPRDPGVDAMQFFSQCVSGAATFSGVPEWVTGECTGLTTCDPASLATGNPCRQACTPGAQTCMTDPLGIADGVAECQDDGTWGPVERCNEGGDARLRCAIKPTPDASALPEALCVEPVCAYVFQNQNGVGGTCEAGQIRSCLEDGTLDDAAACEVGVCRPTTLTPQADSRFPGACDTALECEDGEERCIVDGLVPTPLYQACEGGSWSAALQTCASDEACLDYQDHDGLSHKLCGAECVPGHRRCNASDELEACQNDGSWGAGQACSEGLCQSLGSNDAGCVLECVPSSVQCTGAIVTAPDGSTGYGMEASCSASGVLQTPTACGAGESCRVSRYGEHVGCVECIGADVFGGNALGYTDTRCDPSDAAAVQGCDSDNTWSASRTCTAGTSCIGPVDASCGTCLSAAGNSVVCTQTNVDDLEVCGSCTVNAMLLPQCTETAVDAAQTGETCATQFGGGVTAWGGVADCCDGDGGGGAGEFLQTSGATCGTLGYGLPGPWAGETDCCSTYWLDAGGPSFAYCGP